MSIELVFTYDALNCLNTASRDGMSPFDTIRLPKSWHELEDLDYCPDCWSTIKLENGLGDDD